MKYFIATLLMAAFMVLPAQAQAPQKETPFVRYSPAEGEYSLVLPEAPSAETLWGRQGKTLPFIGDPPFFGAVGEKASFQQTDRNTGDTFDVSVTFIKANKEFLKTLNQQKMISDLEAGFKGMTLDRREEKFTAGSDTLKWATLTGFNISTDNSLTFHAAHYLAGLESISVIKMSFAIENKTYQSYYDKINKSITYTGS